MEAIFRAVKAVLDTKNNLTGKEKDGSTGMLH